MNLFAARFLIAALLLVNVNYMRLDLSRSRRARALVFDGALIALGIVLMVSTWTNPGGWQ